MHQHNGPYNVLEDARTFDGYFNHYKIQSILSRVGARKPMGKFIADALNGMIHVQLKTLKGLKYEVVSEYEMSLTTGSYYILALYFPGQEASRPSGGT